MFKGRSPYYTGALVRDGRQTFFPDGERSVATHPSHYARTWFLPADQHPDLDGLLSEILVWYEKNFPHAPLNKIELDEKGVMRSRHGWLDRGQNGEEGLLISVEGEMANGTRPEEASVLWYIIDELTGVPTHISPRNKVL